MDSDREEVDALKWLGTKPRETFDAARSSLHGKAHYDYASFWGYTFSSWDMLLAVLTRRCVIHRWKFNSCFIYHQLRAWFGFLAKHPYLSHLHRPLVDVEEASCSSCMGGRNCSIECDVITTSYHFPRLWLKIWLLLLNLTYCGWWGLQSAIFSQYPFNPPPKIWLTRVQETLKYYDLLWNWRKK